ncbi:CopG family ribbon-helix-helix protein [Gloeobacter morelensis]|uniref:CopG family transcriptional regulator n=1 Tax=Gloeobacter morelensis MG652769 TaxID=2781736 RepID=A0ABY3PJ00_9CYAN|nr:CopG family transcriptional regulator [Gloeobacter morelensis]UFP93589.1 CopG family transcriptional regulator [Gloeobacter morelensis MG652769]
MDTENKTELIAFRLSLAKKVLLDRVATLKDRDRSHILNEALDLYLEQWMWETDHIQRALARAEQEGDAGIATAEEVKAAFDAWRR